MKDFSNRWVTERPQILVGVGLLVGLAVLIVSVLVATGVWVPWELPSAPSAPMPPAAPSLSAEQPPQPPPQAAPSEVDPWTKALESLKEFRSKYPAESTPKPPAQKKDTEPKESQTKPAATTSPPSSDDAETTFFGMPAEKSANPSPE